MILYSPQEIYKKVNKDVPLGYEYDSNTNSIVLLKGYNYIVSYKNSKVTDEIDLRTDYWRSPPEYSV